MFGTTFKRQAIALVVIATLVMILVVANAFGKVPTTSDRANTAWSQRLTGQAAQELETARNERAMAALSARLTAQAASYKAHDPQVEAARAARAAKAWSDRLTAQAAAELAAK